MEKKRKTTDDELIPKNCVIMMREPLEGYTPDDIREYLTENSNDWRLATAFAMVWNQTGWVMHDVDDPDYDEETQKMYFDRYKVWRDLDDELRRAVIARVTEQSNLAEGSVPEMDVHDQIDWFLNQNGYICCSGWWVKKDYSQISPDETV